VEQEVTLSDQAAAIRYLLVWLDDQKGCSTSSLDAVGHRVVHGGEEFTASEEIDERMLLTVSQIGYLAPLHNGPALEVIRETRRVLGGSLPMVAVFDTAFHRTLPNYARRYAIPEEMTIKHQLWRYGFHGLAHRWMMERFAALANRQPNSLKLVTLQLGSGCSAAAIQNGRSVETSMGLTPLEGLMMATRSGDIDPSLPGWLSQQEGVGIEQVRESLNTRSGLLGVHGSIQDVRGLLEAEQKGDGRARLALEMFCHRVRKYLGAYLAVMGGADAVIFGGGIGENAPAIRERICANMNWCGLHLRQERNAPAAQEGCISTDDSPISVYVVPVNEEVLIAREAFKCLSRRGLRA
jgi:acetate kinase